MPDVAEGSLYSRLHAAILNGDYRPGTILVETAVAAQYGVSRTPVRDALRALEKDGILQYRGRHLIVRITTLEEVMEIYDCRIVLEGVAAEWAARARSDNDLVLLEMALNDMSGAARGTPSEKTSVNYVFHDRLWRSSHNATLVDLLSRLEVHCRRYPEPTVSQPGRWEVAVAEHKEIIDAVRRRDEENASRLAREHMAAARDLRLQMVRREASQAFQGADSWRAAAG
ncbi:MAG: GntR family transcriptional regulator [Naasia sp.]|jgi:DNA-binding GntR family transcriptional regulator|uniref:GntR family transcriptional regulator n=1 Tax=Naasia sp. TaxID=2546198 RepID=UPI00260C2302|nr:GntR family transcriptional regulator [Naasia sp.]MCU1570161.1 GntR family transcriptional regulator [Naasia sp.]